jgi:RNA polymerase sigma-70 factor (ECF subfamily)
VFTEERKDFDRFTWGIVKKKAIRMVGRPGIRHQDRPDIEQQLLLRLVEKAAAFDPKRSHSNAFVTMVIEQATANIVRDQRAPKRDPTRICSLNAPVGNEDDRLTELIDTVGQREHDARHQRRSRPEQEQAELANDVHAVIAALPGRLRQLAEQLQTMTVAEIAREAGIARSTINDRVSELRRRFEKAGLREYL